MPPGAQVLIDYETGQRTASLPLWVYWLQIAHRHADAAESASLIAKPLSLERARDVTGIGRPKAGPEGNLEMVEAMIAISSSANAIDAVFGSVHEVDPWKPAGGRKKGASRTGEIVEQLKHSFVVGKHATEWSRDLDWLFQLRHSIVHHSERPRPMEIAAADSRNVVLSATEAYSLTAVAARRAVDLVDRIVTTCLNAPDDGVREWAQRATKLKKHLGESPGPSGPPPSIEVLQEGTQVHITATPASSGERGGSAP